MCCIPSRKITPQKLKEIQRVLATYERPNAITKYVKRTRGSTCQLCGYEGFRKRNGTLYCESVRRNMGRGVGTLLKEHTMKSGSTQPERSYFHVRILIFSKLECVLPDSSNLTTPTQRCFSMVKRK